MIDWFCYTEGKQFLDSQCITTDDDLRHALTDWEAMGVKLAYEDNILLLRKIKENGESPATVTCFLCGKSGQKALECRNKINPVDNPVLTIFCFHCGKEDHKSPICPEKLAGKKLRVLQSKC